MANVSDNALRMAALCKKLGNLWSADEVKIDEEILEGRFQECNLTLFGKMYTKSIVNFHALLSTLKKAWKIEDVSCAQIDTGLFSVTFSKAEDKIKIVEEGDGTKYAGPLHRLRPL